MSAPFIHPTAIIDGEVQIGEDSHIWHFVHVCTGAQIGQGCSLGQNVMIGQDVAIGNNVKIQNNVAVYTGTTLEDDVFLGPSCVLTNVTNPRSQISRKAFFEKTLIKRGATVGANATIVCGIALGRYAFIAAGAVVTQSVPDYALIVGTPGKQVGWMSRHGHQLDFQDTGLATCPESGLKYALKDNQVTCLDLDEAAPLPAELSTGKDFYRNYKNPQK